MKWLGNLLIATSLFGFVGLGLMVADVEPPWATRARPAAVSVAQPAVLSAPVVSARGEPEGGTPSAPRAAGDTAAITANDARPTPTPMELPAEARLPIDHITIPSIGLDAGVVQAALIEKDGALTWDIPKQKAGHAEGTAGAGALGNAVLLGHVDSIRSGDVFRDLEKVEVGQLITVRSGSTAYTYEVVEAKVVDRADTSMVQTTQTSSITLFTCHGQWLPTIWDYTHRFVVRADLREITA
jgi:LPXTG-site transpeptidase (sortase) family protein